jgi:hypothetical protein
MCPDRSGIAAPELTPTRQIPARLRRRAIEEVLGRDHRFETWCLFEDDAQLPHLLTLLSKKLPDALGPEDRLLFYFAGHGIALDGDAGPAGYLVPARRFERDGFMPMHMLHREIAGLLCLCSLWVRALHPT